MRNVFAKRQKVEEGRERRKIAAEERKAKSKTNVVVTGNRKQGNCKAATIGQTEEQKCKQSHCRYNVKKGTRPKPKH